MGAIRLYNPHRRILRHDDLAELGAPERPGLFETSDPYGALQGVAAHRLAIADPAHWRVSLALWWALRREPGGDAYVGPALYFDPAAFTPPVLPIGGLAVDQVLRKYLAGVPGVGWGSRRGQRSPLWHAMIALSAEEPCIAVRRYRYASPLWRRTVQAPRFHDPAELELWLARQRALPSPQRLARWYQGVRAAGWRSIALQRLLADLAEERIVAYGSDDEAVPVTFWDSGVVELDVTAANLLGAARTFLATGLRVYAAGDRPAAVAQHEAVRAALGGSFSKALRDVIAAHRDELVAMPSRPAQIRFISERLPGIGKPACLVALQKMIGGDFRRREARQTAPPRCLAVA